MKIAIVTNRFPELSETFVINHITSLIDAGHEVSICSLVKPIPQQKVQEKVYKYKLIEKTYYFDIDYSNREQYWRSFKIICKNFLKITLILKCLFNKRQRRGHAFRNLVRLEPFLKKKFDIVHCHFGPAAKEMVFIKDIIKDVKFVTTFHGYDISKLIQMHGEGIYEELFLKGDLFLPVSHYFKDRLVEIGCPENKIKVHHMGIDVEKFSLKQNYDMDGQTIVLTSVGRLVEKKGHAMVIRALEKVVKKHPNIIYKIGGDGPLKNKLQDLVYELSLEEKVHFLGSLGENKVVQLYQETDIFLLPSVTSSDGDQEGIPVVLMEAMAMGIPVVSTIHSGIPELIEDGQSGYLVEEHDAEQLADKINYVLSHRQDWLHLGKNERAKIQKEFNSISLDRQLENIYQELLKKTEGQNSTAMPGSIYPSINNKPLVSVVIPTFNREGYICETIDSVLAQTYPHVEVIVVDDGSKDNTTEVINARYSTKIKYLRQENKGNSTARNLGLKHASGKYIAFLDDDDLWLEHKLETEVNFLEKNPGLGFVYSATYYINDKGEITGQRALWDDEESTFERLYQGNIIISPSVVLTRKSCLDAIGDFDEKLIQSQDYDLFLRLAKKFKFAYMHELLSKYRIHSNNLSRNLDQRLKGHMLILRKPEIIEGKSWLEVLIRIADDYYQIATLFYKDNQYFKAGKYYFGAICHYPFIGFYHWPNEIKKIKFSFIYRILKVYFLVMYCFWKNFFPDKKAV